MTAAGRRSGVHTVLTGGTCSVRRVVGDVIANGVPTGVARVGLIEHSANAL